MHNTKLYKLIISLWMLIIATISCTEIIDMEYTTDFERLVVDAQILDKDTVQYINLSKINLEPENNIVSPISNANVIINDGENDIIFIESDTLKGFYVAPEGFIGEHGKNYNLTITETGVKGTDESDTYFASAKMANMLIMDSATAEFVNNPNFHIKGFFLKCWAWEPPEKNFYLFKAWKNGILLTDTLFEYEQSNDDIFNGIYLNGVNCYLLQDRKEDEYVNSGDTLTLEIDNIDEAYFEYLNSAQKEYHSPPPIFAGPPANVTSNISNGAVGIFRVYSVAKSSVIVHDANRE